jgi:hypothetical protein
MWGRATEPPWLILADKIKEIVASYYDVSLTKTAITTSITITGVVEDCGDDVSVIIKLTDEEITFIDHYRGQDKCLVPYIPHRADQSRCFRVVVPIAQPDSIDKIVEWLRESEVSLDETKVAELLK